MFIDCIVFCFKGRTLGEVLNAGGIGASSVVSRSVFISVETDVLIVNSFSTENSGCKYAEKESSQYPRELLTWKSFI